MNVSTITLTLGDREFPLQFRTDSVGDNGVITQIFKQNDYRVDQWPQGRCLIEHYRTIVSSSKRPLIIDAGANIGASPLWFWLAYPEAFIFSVEPQRDNFELLEANTAVLSHKINFYGAIGSEEGRATIQDPGFSDWAFRTTRVYPGELTALSDEPSAPTIETISPRAILSRIIGENTTPFIFKIDIEGAEADLFQEPTDWIDEFPLIVIELHDWMFPFAGTSKPFLRAMSAREFDFVHRGENLFCFNRALLSRYQE
jgi:FkbM family methyltransferase